MLIFTFKTKIVLKIVKSNEFKIQSFFLQN